MSQASGMTQEQVSAHEVRTDKLILGGAQVTRVATADDISQDQASPMDLISRGALDLLLQEINRFLKTADPNGPDLDDLALITRSTVDPYFECAQDWVLHNWYIQDNLLNCKSSDNWFKIANSGFPYKGKYLLCINVDELPSGKIDIYFNQEWIGSIVEEGTTYKEITISDVSTDEVKFTVVGLEGEQTIVVFSLSVHRISDNLYGYLISKIKELATVDAHEYMSKVELAHTLDDFTVQFQEATRLYLNQLKLHEDASNPHHITPETIRAAREEHIHEQYLTKNEMAVAVDEQMSRYALIGHVHSQYLTMAETKAIILSTLQEHMYANVSIAPGIVTKGPIGILPGPFAEMDISTPTTILLPTVVNHNAYTSFDDIAGIVSTNHADLLKEVPRIFCRDSDVWGKISTKQFPINFRLMYHTYREISGYQIRCRGGYPTDWSIFIGDTTYMHRLTADRDAYVEEDGWLVKDIYFEHVEEAPMFAIRIDSAEMDSTMELSIDILYEDFADEQTFGVTSEPFQFSVPSGGNTRIINIPKRANKTAIKPDVCMENVPVYIFGGKEVTDKEAEFSYSYIPPEYGLVRKGLDILADKFNGLVREAISGKETYIHNAFGVLSLEKGYSHPDCSLTDIFTSEGMYWKSDGQTNEVSISFLVLSDDVVLTGYALEWDMAVEDLIPDTWSLTITGYTADGKERHIAMDSVQQYYPIYSVEDDDIIYHKSFDAEVTVKQITLTMTRRDGKAPQIALNRLKLFLSEHYYSIPGNTMYLGVKEVASICLGSAHYTEGKGWKPVNLPIGRSCVRAVNNLKTTEANATYSIPNPFHTADVSVEIHNYNIIEGQHTEGPLAYVSKITPDTIEMVSEHPYQYALAIHRKW